MKPRGTSTVNAWLAQFLTILAVIAMPFDAKAQPVPGFVEEWPGTSLQGWAGGSTLANPGTDGVGGVGDGFLSVTSGANQKLGTVSFGTEYTGDWNAAGIRSVRFWLNNIGFNQPIEIHFSLGNGGNFWQYDAGFIPPFHAWSEFSVDLTNAAGFTQTLGGGTYDDALAAVDRVHVRHDLPPFVHAPDLISNADFGFDRLQLIGNVLGVPSSPGASGTIEMAPPRPNPSRGPVALVVRSTDGGPITLEIVDVTGRRVREARLSQGEPGERIWLWDGLDDRGAPVAAGAYRVRAYGPGGGTSRSIVRVY